MTQTTDPQSNLLKSAQKAMYAGDFAVAADLADRVLDAEPDHVEALYMMAVSARYEGQFDRAETFLTKLKHVSPEFGRAYQESGHLSRKTGNPEAAIAAYARAVQYNPALTASWKALADLHKAQGRQAEVAQALAQAARIDALPHELLAVTHHLHEGRILKAEQVCRAFMQANPHHVEGMRLLADIGVRLGVHEDAQFLLETAKALEPDNIQIRLDLIQVLRKRQRFEAALAEARELHARDRANPLFQSHLAIESMQAGDYETALSLFESVLETLPKDPATLTSRGHALKTAGETDAAIESYRAAIAADPNAGDAWYALANLKTYRFAGEEVAAMRAAEARPDRPFMARVHLCFALGKALEDAGAHDESFRFYARGNALKSTQTRYTSDQMLAELDAQQRHCTSALFDAQAGKGCAAPDPIFIVGLPRAGSTLVEQILASHSRVDGTLELPNILSLAHRLRGRKYLSDRERYPRVLHELSGDELRELGEDYIENTRIHRQGAPFFTDKMPNNFRHIGLIHLILPNAKIIDARRNPMDCCWSGFKQLFAEGQEFSYSLPDIGEYYRAYVDLMAHWDEVLPGVVLKVQHEDVLSDLEGQVARLLDHCGLPFEEACVNFHETRRAVRTASSEQVRQPINTSGLGQWLPFESHLGPLKDALGPHAPPRQIG